MSKFAMSYSCGKDSTLALHKMIQQKKTPVALLVTINEEVERSWFHGVDETLLLEISKSLDIPLIMIKTNGLNYEEKFSKEIFKAKELGAEFIAFGDIDIEEHKIWGEKLCKENGLEAVYPLWQQNRIEITKEFVNLGYSGIIKAVTKKHKLPIEYLGKKLDMNIIKEFENFGIDPCGENGEYHTFVYDGPIFNKKIYYTDEGIYESEHAFSLNISGKK